MQICLEHLKNRCCQALALALALFFCFFSPLGGYSPLKREKKQKNKANANANVNANAWLHLFLRCSRQICIYFLACCIYFLR